MWIWSVSDGLDDYVRVVVISSCSQIRWWRCGKAALNRNWPQWQRVDLRLYFHLRGIWITSATDPTGRNTMWQNLWILMVCALHFCLRFVKLMFNFFNFLLIFFDKLWQKVSRADGLTGWALVLMIWGQGLHSYRVDFENWHKLC